MKLVIIESPFAGDIRANRRYARRALLDSINRGEVPFASHLLYPQVLDDNLPADRELGIKLGLHWAAKADLAAFYVDLGPLTPGMLAAQQFYLTQHIPIEFRHIYKKPKAAQPSEPS
jgi:hypothetical protein